MKRRIVTLLLAATVVCSMTSTSLVFADDAEETEETTEAAEEEEAEEEDAEEEDAAETVDFGVEPEFEPNEEYDMYTVLEYTIEDIGAEMVVTVSAMEDGSKYEIQCNFYGDDQLAVVEYDGSEYTVTEDKTGFMQTDSPLIIEKAIENDLWAEIGGASEEVDFGVEPEFEPNPDYDLYTALEYTIEDIGAEMVVTVSAMEDGSKYEIQCNFYGDDQLSVVEFDGEEYTVTEDKTGFMQTDSPLIIEKALENDLWAEIGGSDDAETEEAEETEETEAAEETEAEEE